MVAPLCTNVENIQNNKNEVQALTGTEIDELDSISYTDLYVLGKIWIDALKTGLVGANVDLFPVVKAAKVDDTPKKPPYMKYKDLSLYKSPHCECKEKCFERNYPDAKVKLLHQYLLPYVKDGRRQFHKGLNESLCPIICNCRRAVSTINKSKVEVKQSMRDPDNLAVRQGAVAAGGLAGYLIGRGGGVPRLLFFTSAGLLSPGALCFPKETDEAFRNATFVAAKAFIALYNKWCGKDFNLREKLACRDELPGTSPKEPPSKCPPSK